jgi:outer membrane protein TolC
MIIIVIVLSFSSIYAQPQQLSLEDCIQIALKGNASIIINKNINESSGEDVTASYSGILPYIDLSASSGRYEAGAKEVEQDVPVILPDSSVVVRRTVITQDPYLTDFNNLGISVNQNLFDGGEWWQAIKYAKSQKRSSDYNLVSIINSTVLSVQEAFFNLLKQKKLLEVNQLAVARSEDQLNKTQKMFELGAVAKVDVFRSKVNLGNDKIQMLLQQNAVLTAKHNLNLVMGQDPQTEFEIKPEFELTQSFKNVDELFGQAVEMNPDLKKQEEDVIGYDLTVSRSYAVLWPALGAFFSYDRRNEGIERVYTGWKKNWSMNWGLSLRLNLFNGFNDKVRIQKSKLAMRNAQQTLEESKRTLKSEIITLVDNFNSYLNIIDINEENLEAAKEEYRLAEERYRIGSGTALEVREAQVNLTRAEETLVAAQYNARMTQAQVERALGVIYTQK